MCIFESRSRIGPRFVAVGENALCLEKLKVQLVIQSRYGLRRATLGCARGGFRWLNLRQSTKCPPLCFRKTAFGEHVRDLFFGANVLDLNAWVRVDTFEEPVQIHSVSAGNMSHVRATAFDGHLDDGVVVLEKI